MLSFTNVPKPRISPYSCTEKLEKVGNENEFCVYPFGVYIDLLLGYVTVYLSHMVNRSWS